MRTQTRGLLMVVGLLAALPLGDAAAQRRRGLVDVSPAHARHGFWFSAGLAAGGESSRFSNDPAGYNETLYKPTLSLALGGTVNPNFRLGGEMKIWSDEYYDAIADANVTETLFGALLVGQFYPSRSMGLFLKGGGGVSRVGTSVGDGFFGDDVGEWGFAYLVGAGYEARVGRNVFITPFVDLMHHRSSQRGDPLGTLHDRLVSFGVNITFQAGR